MKLALLLLPLALALPACGGDDFTCELGPGARGTWEVTFEETSGDCGDLEASTVNLAASGSNGCEYRANEVSDDRCRVEADFVCPLAGGTVHWVTVLEQVSEDELVGTGTLVAAPPDGSGEEGCRSTYDIRYERL